MKFTFKMTTTPTWQYVWADGVVAYERYDTSVALSVPPEVEGNPTWNRSLALLLSVRLRDEWLIDKTWELLEVRS